MDLFKSLFSDFIHKPKNTSFSGEDKEEIILYLVRRDIVTNLPWIIISAILFFIPGYFQILLTSANLDISSIVPQKYAYTFGLLWYVFIFVYILESYVTWYFNVYIVTNKRLVDVDFYGFLNRKVTEAPLSVVQDVTYTVKGIFSNIFDYGTVFIQTAGDRPQLEFENCPRPAFLHDIISDLATAEQGGNKGV